MHVAWKVEDMNNQESLQKKANFPHLFSLRYNYNSFSKFFRLSFRCSPDDLYSTIYDSFRYEDNNENEKFMSTKKCLDLIISKRAQFFSDISETRFLKRILKTIAFLDSSHHTKICGHVIFGSFWPTPRQHGKPQKSNYNKYFS